MIVFDPVACVLIAAGVVLVRTAVKQAQPSGVTSVALPVAQPLAAPVEPTLPAAPAAQPVQQPEPARVPPPLAVVRKATEGALHEVLSEHPAGRIADEIKEALRTPGLGVRWHDGHIEWGQE